MAVGSVQQAIDSGTAAEDFMYTALVVVAWFVLNIALANFTKWTFVYGEVCIDNHCEPYKFPLTITVLHMVFSWALCHIYIFYIRREPQKVILSFRQQLQKVAPLAACFALSVAMGNLSLKYIYPSFNQMLGATTPLITVLISIPMGKRYNKYTWLSMPVICGGLVIYCAKEGNFNWLGAFFATGATVLRAVKSIIQGKLLVDSTEKVDAVTLLYYMAPYAAGIVLVAALATEGLKPFRMLDPRLLAMGAVEGSSSGNGTVMLLLLAGGMNACLLNIANFVVTGYTSPVTLQVLGNVKSCLSIVVSVAIFGNSLSPIQGVGVVICLLGVWGYQRYGGAIKDSAPLARNMELEAVSVGQPPATEKGPLAESEEL